MKTLILTFSYLNGNGGGIYASRTHINLFSRISEETTLMYPSLYGGEPEGIYCDRMHLVPVIDKRSKIKKFIDLCFGKMHRFSLDTSFINPHRFDTVVFDSSVVSARLIKKFRKVGIKTITIHHNYQIEYLKGDCPWYILPQSLFWTWIYERQAVVNSDLNLTLTTQDVDSLRNHYSKSAVFAVLGVFEYKQRDLEFVKERERGHHYVMTGGLSSVQTEASILRWLKDYYAILKREDPQMTLTIAGNNPSARLSNAIERKGIKLIPSPYDMRPILESSDYYICPIDCGGGLKLRNMDGLKYGLPVLTHIVSARGYEKVVSKGLLLQYTNQAEFAEGIRKLLCVRKTREEIQCSYSMLFSFEVGVDKLSKLLKEFL